MREFRTASRELGMRLLGVSYQHDPIFASPFGWCPQIVLAGPGDSNDGSTLQRATSDWIEPVHGEGCVLLSQVQSRLLAVGLRGNIDRVYGARFGKTVRFLQRNDFVNRLHFPIRQIVFEEFKCMAREPPNVCALSPVFARQVIVRMFGAEVPLDTCCAT